MKILTIIVVAGIVFGMPIGAEAQQQIVFEDDFTDNSNEWYLTDTEECTIAIENGTYVFEHKREEGAWLSWQAVDIDQQGDFAITVTINKVSGVDNYGYGLVWGLEDVSNYQQFIISGNGYYRHGILANDEWSEVIEWTPAESINQENATNTLSIRKSENQIQLYINDQYVNEAEAKSFFGDKVGFIVYRKMRLEIDYLLVEQFSPIEIPPTPVPPTPIPPTVVSPTPVPLLTVSPTPAPATPTPQPIRVPEKRLALVIGNSDYGDPPLSQALNDAEDMTIVLQSLGFTVIKKTNLDQQEMEEAVAEFSRRIQNGEVALFYFSGYGGQVRGENYLLPVAGNIRSESHLLYGAVKLGDILRQMEEAANQANIIIVDACREVKGLWLFNKGLAAMDVSSGTVLAYATAPGTLTPEGTARNSVYTKHLLEVMQTPGTPIGQVFENVLNRVAEETGGQQLPWTSSSLQQEFLFYPQ
jgi:hypothetical protein